MNELGLQPRLP